MKKIFGGVLMLVSLYFGYHYYSSDTVQKKHLKKAVSAEIEPQRLEKQVDSLKAFITKNPEYNKDMAFFVDMKIMSGKNRFFIYDFQKDKITDQGLVAHGSGSETGREGKLKFSNVNNSMTTSLGKYAIGNSYEGKFGKAYKLFGLDKTNSNAFERFIVLHYFSAVPYKEQSYPICNSLGCPMVNELFFKRIAKILDQSQKKILLKIYY